MAIRYIEVSKDICNLPYSLELTGEQDMNKIAVGGVFPFYLKKNVSSWLEQNIKKDEWNFIGGVFGIEVLFKNKDDAMKFKMVWL